MSLPTGRLDGESLPVRYPSASSTSCSAPGQLATGKYWWSLQSSVFGLEGRSFDWRPHRWISGRDSNSQRRTMGLRLSLEPCGAYGRCVYISPPEKFGSESRHRTCNDRINSAALYLLSYLAKIDSIQVWKVPGGSARFGLRGHPCRDAAASSATTGPID